MSEKLNIKILLLLHLFILLYSLSGVLIKFAGLQSLFSYKYFLYYFLVILLLVFYAIGWQQIIKRLPLTTAFANKAFTVIWGLIWGYIFFGERITIGKVVGAIFVLIGVIIFSISNEVNTNGHNDI